MELETDSRPKSVEPRKYEFSIVQIATIVYAVMATIGGLLSLYAHHNFYDILTPPTDGRTLGKLTLIIGLSSGILLISSYFFEEFFVSFQNMRRIVTVLLGPGSAFTAFYLAAISAIGEELLFRAAIQPYVGLFLASFLFGLLHLGPNAQVSSWSVWAFFAGLLMGWVFERTGSLWVPIGIHFLVNFIAILTVQAQFRRRIAELAKPSSHD